MHTIAKLVEKMNEELDDACSYAKGAIAYKVEDKELAEVFLSLARTELEHYSKLSAQVDRLIEAKKAAGEVAIEGAMGLYSIMQDRMTAHMAEVRAMIDSYR